jgi:hypothetical protein
MAPEDWQVIEMFKNHSKLKWTLFGMAILLPTLFGIICAKLNVIPQNSADGQIFGAALLPGWLERTSGLQLFAVALICAMVIITAILTGIALTRRMSNKVSNK